MTYKNDSDLIIKVAQGDERAFGELYETYHQKLGSYIFRITESRELAEEVVQDVFLKIWQNRETLAPISNFNSYLFVISKNHALNCLKKLIKDKQYQTSLSDNDAVADIPDETEPNPFYSILDEAIDALPPQQKKVYLLSRHKRMKYAEIATALDLSHETVKKYLKLATLTISNYIKARLGLIGLLAVIIYL